MEWSESVADGCLLVSPQGTQGTLPSLGALARSGFVTGVLPSCIPVTGFLLGYMALEMLNGGSPSSTHPP